jgi:hypothetical protein
MTVRRRLAALLVNLARALSIDDRDPDGVPDSAGPAAEAAADPDPAAAHEPRWTGTVDIAQENAIRQLLETCARAFVSDGSHVRANIMIFTADGLRRAVHRETAFNMADDPDADLEIAATAGASGKAVVYRRAAVADLTLLQITSVPPWGLSTTEQARVRPRLKSILSVPIFDPANVRGFLLGTLQVDSDLAMEQVGFNKPEAAELMQQYADVLSVLMTGIDVQLGEAPATAASPMSHSRVQNAQQVEPGMYVANSSTSIFLISSLPAAVRQLQPKRLQ